MKRVISLAVIVASFALGGVALADTPLTTGPVPGPGCFGLWRAGSVQALNDAGLGPVGLNYFSQRAGDNSTINAENRASCAE